MIYTHCPLCKEELVVDDSLYFFYVRCDSCCPSDVPKFNAVYVRDTKTFELGLLSQAWWVKDYYVQLDFRNDTTTISKIDVCVLSDPIQLSGIINIDHDDPLKTINRILSLMVFS